MQNMFKYVEDLGMVGGEGGGYSGGEYSGGGLHHW